MNIKVEASYKSLNKQNEELCGDKVEIGQKIFLINNE